LKAMKRKKRKALARKIQKMSGFSDKTYEKFSKGKYIEQEAPQKDTEKSHEKSD